MAKRDKDTTILSPDRFMDEFARLKRGSVTRRHFLGVTGLGLATAVLGNVGAPRPAFAARPTSGSFVTLATWPNYHTPKTLSDFTQKTGIAVLVEMYGSNEDMFRQMQTGVAKWDLFVPTNFTLSTYQTLGLIEAVDLSRLPHYAPADGNARLGREGQMDGRTYAVPKNWGTTGMAVNTRKLDDTPHSWAEFFEAAIGEASGHTMLHDYALTTVGVALVALGHSFNSVDPAELEAAADLLMKVKPHLSAIDSDYQPAMRAGDAWLSMCWSNDGAQLHRDMPEIAYVFGADGGEIWTDYYAIPANAPNRDAAYTLLDFLLDPQVALADHIATGTATTDSRVLAMLPEEIRADRITYPDEAALSPLEYAAAITLTDPGRHAVMARLKSF